MALVLGTSTAQISSSIEDLVRQSTLVLEGEVIQKEANWSPDRAYIYTENLIRVDKLYKGQLLDTVVSIITKGGKVGDGVQIHTHHATLPKGQIGVFFAREEPKLNTGRKNFQLTKEEGGFLLIEDMKLNPYVLLETGKKFSYKKLIETIMLETKKPVLTKDLIEYSMKLGDTIDCEILPFAENLKTIDFTFDNVYLTGNNQFVEFDIMAKVNTYGLKFGKAELFVTYNKEPFGEFVVQNGLIEVQKETIVSDATYSMAYLDFDTTSFQIKIEPSGISNNFHTLTTVKEKLVHIKVAISDFTQIGQISFDDIDIGGRVWYYCDGEFYLFDEVNLGNPIFGVNPNPENATGITYTFENLGYNESSSQYSFEIIATATAQTYFSDAYIYVSFNLDAFLPNQATNGDVVFLPGPLINNDAVYSFQMTDQSSNTILLLIYSEFPIEQTNLTILGTTPKRVGTMYLKVHDCKKSANLHFDEQEMQELSYHNVGTMPFPIEIYDPIIASDSEEAKICCTNNPLITSISTPGSTSGNLMPIVAGMGNILTINGSNFGIYGTESKVRFQNGDAASGWMEAAPGDFIWGGANHWSDTKIEVVVPSVDANEAWTKPAASGKVQVRTDCGNDNSDDELDIPYCVLNYRTASFNRGYKLVLKKINGDGVLFQFSENVTSTKVREAFEEALQEWCTVTNINFFLSDTDSDKTSASGNDGVNLIVMESVSSGAASFVLSTIHQEQCVNSSTSEIGYVMKDLDLRIDPSNTSLTKQQIKNRILHELGHAHMLNHSKNLSNPQDLMFYQEVNPSTAATIMGDDETGALLVYSNSAQILNGASCGTPIGQGACGGTNSVLDIHNNEILEVFPNPFSTSIQVSLITSNTSDLTFELFDHLGRQVMFMSEKGGQAEHQLVIPAEIPKGMYLLKTTIGEKTIIATKIVKL